MKIHSVKPIGDCLDGLFGVPLAQLSDFVNCEVSQERISAVCRHCGKPIDCARVVSPFVSCEPCIARIKQEQLEDQAAAYWQRVCPAQFLATNTGHKDFPREIWQRIRNMPLGQSLFLLGPTGTGKTRVAMLRLKQAAVSGNSIKVIWPEQLEAFRGYTAEARYESITGFDHVLLDDCLMTACREARLADSLKHIIDVLMRHARPFIITSQIGSEEFMSGNSYGDLKDADRERGAAIMRRLREICTVVKFI